MKKQIFVSLLILTVALNVQAQTASGNQKKASKPKSARITAASNPIIDSASNAGATNDGASGQSGRPMAIPSSSTLQTSSVKTQQRATRNVKQRSRSNQQ